MTMKKLHWWLASTPVWPLGPKPAPAIDISNGTLVALSSLGMGDTASRNDREWGTILTVQDGRVEHDGLVATLIDAGHDVLTDVRSGDGLQRCLLTQHEPDLVLLHVSTARARALELLVELRRTRERARLPAIVVCDDFDPAFAVACLDAGANDYIAPTLNAAELVARVRSQLLVRRAAERWRNGSYVDPLTGLLNRRGLLPYVDREIARSARLGQPLSIAFLDLDNFSEINNRRGHSAGDDVLRAVGRALRQFKRRCDVAARWGGDEFVLVLPGSGRGTTAGVLVRIDSAITHVRGGARLGASYGIACLFDDVPVASEHAAEQLIDAADLAMYQNKHGHARRGRANGTPVSLCLEQGGAL